MDQQPPSGGTIASRVAARRRRRLCPPSATSSESSGGEDRIGSLPDALLLLILSSLGSTAEAARTSLLSRRWRPVWIELPTLTFRGVGADTLLDLLPRARPHLTRLEIRIARRDIGGNGIPTAQVSTLLRAAEERQPEELVFDVAGGDDDHLPFELPCFARATSINLQVWNRSFTLPPGGEAVFSKLEKLTLSLCWVDPGDFLPRCPLLRFLDVCFCWTRRPEVAVHSMSLQELIVKDVKTLHGDKATQLVDIAAPALKKFKLQSRGNRDLIVAFSGNTVVESSSYKYCSTFSRPVGIGLHWRLLGLTMERDLERRRSRYGGGINHVHVLSLMILADKAPQYMDAKRSFVEEIARLGISRDDISVLKLDFRSDKPLDFGNVVFHLLGSLDLIRTLHLVLRPEEVRGELRIQAYAQLAQHIYLADLEEVEIEGMNISDHDCDFVKALFVSAPLLKVLRIQLFGECPSRTCPEYKRFCGIFGTMIL